MPVLDYFDYLVPHAGPVHLQQVRSAPPPPTPPTSLLLAVLVSPTIGLTLPQYWLDPAPSDLAMSVLASMATQIK